MSYRDSLEAAQARIAQLETQLEELFAASQKGEIEVQNLRADMAIQKLEAEQRLAELAQKAQIEEVVQYEQSQTKIVQLEQRVRALEAQLDAAHAVIERLKAKLGGQSHR